MAQPPPKTAGAVGRPSGYSPPPPQEPPESELGDEPPLDDEPVAPEQEPDEGKLVEVYRAGLYEGWNGSDRVGRVYNRDAVSALLIFDFWFFFRLNGFFMR